jgi:hypothetical protein
VALGGKIMKITKLDLEVYVCHQEEGLFGLLEIGIENKLITEEERKIYIKRYWNDYENDEIGNEMQRLVTLELLDNLGITETKWEEITDYLENEIKGKSCIADIGDNRNWIRYEDGNDGEEDHYRDYVDEDGVLCYCYGESVEVISVNDLIVELKNDENYKFEISLSQFITDFIINVID